MIHHLVIIIIFVISLMSGCPITRSHTLALILSHRQSRVHTNTITGSHKYTHTVRNTHSDPRSHPHTHTFSSKQSQITIINCHTHTFSHIQPHTHAKKQTLDIVGSSSRMATVMNLFHTPQTRLLTRHHGIHLHSNMPFCRFHQ